MSCRLLSEVFEKYTKDFVSPLRTDFLNVATMRPGTALPERGSCFFASSPPVLSKEPLREAAEPQTRT